MVVIEIDTIADILAVHFATGRVEFLPHLDDLVLIERFGGVLSCVGLRCDRISQNRCATLGVCRLQPPPFRFGLAHRSDMPPALCVRSLFDTLMKQ